VSEIQNARNAREAKPTSISGRTFRSNVLDSRSILINVRIICLIMVDDRLEERKVIFVVKTFDGGENPENRRVYMQLW